MPPTKRRAVKPPVAKKGKRAAQEEAEDDFFLGSDDDNKKVASEEEEEEVEETTEQTRLRLAQQYLSKLRKEEESESSEEEEFKGVTGGKSDDEEDEEEEEEIGVELKDRLAARLKADVAADQGRLHRRLAASVRIPAVGEEGYVSPATCRGHRLALTSVALTSDDRTAFTVSKDGSIIKWDVETMTKTIITRPGTVKTAGGVNPSTGSRPSNRRTNTVGGAARDDHQNRAEWVKPAARVGSKGALYAVAVSSDGKYMAAAGGDRKIHVYDGKSGEFIQSFGGHKDSVTSLVFREGTHVLLSASFDRTVKLWSLDDRAYMDSLFGHQAEILAVDCLRTERAVTAAHDHTCRIWKIPEETQLVFRARDAAVDCCRYVTSTEWISGGTDGAVHLWSQLKKRPVYVARDAHNGRPFGADASTSASSVSAEQRWVSSVAVCRSSDLAASGAGDGFIRLWSLDPSKQGGAGAIRALGSLPQRGYVNGLAIARSAAFVAAAVGQEPRLGRWSRDAGARNGLVIHRLNLEDSQA